MPTWLLKSVCEYMAPIIASMCNASISQNRFPVNQKTAIVRPLLKKCSVNPTDVTFTDSLRPIYNFSFVSRLLERAIDSRFTQHALTHNLVSPVQLAYRKHHSTEPALIKIYNDMVTSTDRGHVGVLALLDLSSAFDTVDQQLLLQVLHQRFSVTDSALSWFQSYLTDRAYVVAANDQSSRVVKSCHGVPQGSVLGPKKFIAYTEDIDATFQNHGLNHHCFADDTQMYIAIPRTEAHTIAAHLQRCIGGVSDWCASSSRRLQLNAAKTEFIWFGSKSSRDCLSDADKAIVIANETIQPVESVRDLSVHLDSELNMKAHITKKTQACFFQIRQIRRLLGRVVTANLVFMFILSRLDYYKALLAGLPQSTTAPLHRVLNAAVRFFCNLRSRDHVTPALRELHRLPIAARMQYKLCLLVYSAVVSTAPDYT